MTHEFDLHDARLQVTDEVDGAFGCFKRGHKQATDEGPHGMIAEMDAFVRLTEGRSRFLDIGALFGVFSFVFARNPGCTAYAVEPSPPAFNILVDMCNANPSFDVKPLQQFAGEATGHIARVGREWFHMMPGKGSETVTVRAVDDMVIGEIDCMKVDVEGYECAVLRGARKLLETYKPLLFLELHLFDLHTSGDTPDSLRDLITDLGYEARKYDGEPFVEWNDTSMTRVVGYPV